MEILGEDSESSAKDFEMLYHKAFRAIKDAERLLKRSVVILEAVQRECEYRYAENGPIQPDNFTNDDTE